MSMPRKQALALATIAISGFLAWLYLATFAGILNLAYRTGEITIKADSLMLVESLLLLLASICIAYMVIHSLVAIASQLRRSRESIVERI